MTESEAFSPPPADTGLALVRRWWGEHPIAQAIGLLGAAVVLGIAASNILASMHRLGMSPTLDYLSQPANFDISESLIAYHAGDPYWRAILVGILNTLKLAASGCAHATALGLFLGIARVAGNPLVSKLVEAYVELVRNTPLVLQPATPGNLSFRPGRVCAMDRGRARRRLALGDPARAHRRRRPRHP